LFELELYKLLHKFSINRQIIIHEEQPFMTVSATNKPSLMQHGAG